MPPGVTPRNQTKRIRASLSFPRVPLTPQSTPHSLPPSPPANWFCFFLELDAVRLVWHKCWVELLSLSVVLLEAVCVLYVIMNSFAWWLTVSIYGSFHSWWTFKLLPFSPTLPALFSDRVWNQDLTYAKHVRMCFIQDPSPAPALCPVSDHMTGRISTYLTLC